MVLIISKHDDHSTDKVMNWLYYMKKTCYRLNGEEILNSKLHIKIEIEAYEQVPKINIDTQNLKNFDNIDSIWFRRDSFIHFVKNMRSDFAELRPENYHEQVLRSLYDEYYNGKSAFYSCLEIGKKKLGNFRRSSINKIETLALAKEYGLDIPATMITNLKSDVEKFAKKHGSIITKPIFEACLFSDQGKLYCNYTEEVTEEIINSLSDSFLHSLFQENLNKEIEVRSFFLDGKCYSMAIFSQLDCQTNVDFRKYNHNVNNRNVPYQLPKLIEERINHLMRELQLNTGSLDIVKTRDGRFVFLEVNPIGQYGMTSIPCNYHLDKIIAEFLIK